MSEGRRGAVAIALLAVACVALVATSPLPPTASESVEGDVSIGPGDPTEVRARFTVSPPGADSIQDVQVVFDVPPSTLLDARLNATADGRPPELEQSFHSLYLPTGACTDDGCVIDAWADLAWAGPPADPVRVRWQIGLKVEYSRRVPEPSPVSGIIIAGVGPAVPRLGWLGIGSLLGLLTAVVWTRMGRRWSGLRQSIATVSLVPIVVLGLTAGVHPPDDPQRWIIMLLAIVLAAMLIGGIIGLHGGNSLLLPMFGWLYIGCIGFFVWLAVRDAHVYRPHEAVAIGFVVVAAGVAAITSAPLAKPPMRLLANLGTSLVAASQVAELLVAATIAGLSAFLVIAEFVRRPSLVVLLAAIPLFVMWLFIIGLRRWFRGARGILLLANCVMLVPALFLVLATLAQGPGSLFIVTDEASVFVVLFLATVLVGIVGAAVVPPPVVIPPSDP